MDIYEIYMVSFENDVKPRKSKKIWNQFFVVKIKGLVMGLVIRAS